MKRLSFYTDLLRVRYSTYPPAAAISGAILTQYTSNTWNPVIIAASALIILLLWWGGMVTNHIFDIEIDRRAISLAHDKNLDINVVKENHPLATGILSIKEALIVVTSTYAPAFAIALSINMNCFLLTLAIFLGTQVYNKILKHHSLVGSMFFALLVSQSFVMGAVVAGGMTLVHYFIILSTVLYHTGVHIFGCIKDYDSDRHVGSRTLAVDLGIKRSAIRGVLFLLGGYLVAIVPFLLTLLHPGYLILAGASAFISLPKAFKTVVRPAPSMGWETLSASIPAATLLYLSYSFGTIALPI